jgi:uncharacterized Zn finger protein
MMARRRGRTRFSGYDDSGWSGFAPYVPVADRRREAQRELQRLRKSGHAPAPIEIRGRAIATTFWGRAWCDNLERYGDFANRIPRGRTYVRNGSVVDLQIDAGRVEAFVSGSCLYEVGVKVTPVPAARWRRICGLCAGGIDSLVELLQGRFSDSVMAHLCQQGTGLFPTPAEIEFTCSCPDWASMCKHVAAVLYGVGARLDHQPEFLFRLRQVDENDLIVHAGSAAPLAKKEPAASRVLAESDLADVFDVELAAPVAAPSGPARGRRKPIPPATPAARPAAAKDDRLKNGAPKGRATKGVAPKGRATKGSSPAPQRRPGTRRFTAAERRAVSERMKRYWEERRKQTRKA